MGIQPIGDASPQAHLRLDCRTGSMSSRSEDQLGFLTGLQTRLKQKLLFRLNETFWAQMDLDWKSLAVATNVRVVPVNYHLIGMVVHSSR